MLGPALEGRAAGIGAAGREGASVSPPIASSGTRRGAVAGARSGICRGAAGGAGAAVVGATGDSSAPRRVSSASARSRSAAGDPRRHAKTPAISTAMATTMASSMGKGGAPELRQCRWPPQVRSRRRDRLGDLAGFSDAISGASSEMAGTLRPHGVSHAGASPGVPVAIAPQASRGSCQDLVWIPPSVAVPGTCGSQLG